MTAPLAPAPPTPPPSSPLPPASPSPTAPFTPVPLPDDNGGWFDFDLGRQVADAIESWLRGLVRSAVNPLLEFLGDSLLSTPAPESVHRLAQIWQASQVIANTLLVLFVLGGGMLVMTNQTVQTQWTLREVAPRLLFGAAAANASWLIASQAIGLANALADALLGPLSPAQAARALREGLLTNAGLFYLLLALAVVVLLVVLLLVWVIRLMITFLLIGAAPLALICHALPQTDGLARMWWRAFIGVLAIQCAQALVLITALRVFFAGGNKTWLGGLAPGGLLDLLIVICLLYVLTRIPFWIHARIFSGSSPITRVARLAALAWLFRKARPGRRPAPGPEGRGETRPRPAPDWKPRPGPNGQLMLPWRIPRVNGPTNANRPRLGDLPAEEPGPPQPGPGQLHLPLNDADGFPLAGWGPISKDARWQQRWLNVKAPRVPAKQRKKPAERLGELAPPERRWRQDIPPPDVTGQRPLFTRLPAEPPPATSSPTPGPGASAPSANPATPPAPPPATKAPVASGKASAAAARAAEGTKSTPGHQQLWLPIRAERVIPTEKTVRLGDLPEPTPPPKPPHVRGQGWLRFPRRRTRPPEPPAEEANPGEPTRGAGAPAQRRQPGEEEGGESR